MKNKKQRGKERKTKKRRKMLHMNKSIQNDADIMLLISQHFNIVCDWVWYSVSCRQQGERTTRANMGLIEVQTGTSLKNSFRLSSRASTVHFGKGYRSFLEVLCFILVFSECTGAVLYLQKVLSALHSRQHHNQVSNSMLEPVRTPLLQHLPPRFWCFFCFLLGALDSPRVESA